MNFNSLNLEQLYLTLLSGLLGSVLGALVGGYYSYQGAMDAAKTQIENLYKQEKEKRDYEKKREEKVVFSSLMSEAKENLDLATKWQVSYSKSILSTETWSIYKGSISSFTDNLQEKIIKAYAEIKRYNALAEYDRAKIAVGHGVLDQALQQQAVIVIKALNPLIDELENSRKVVPPQASEKK